MDSYYNLILILCMDTYLKSLRYSDENELLQKGTLIQKIDYITKYDKKKLLEIILSCKELGVEYVQYFNKIKNSSLFSVFLYSDYVKRLGCSKNVLEELLSIACFVKGGLDMFIR